MSFRLLEHFMHLIISVFPGILHWGGGRRSWAPKHDFLCGCTFFSKNVDDLFLVFAVKTAYLRLLRCTSGRGNSVTLLNKAGLTSQQSQLFPLKNYSIDPWHPLWLRPCVCFNKNNLLYFLLYLLQKRKYLNKNFSKRSRNYLCNE